MTVYYKRVKQYCQKCGKSFDNKWHYIGWDITKCSYCGSKFTRKEPEMKMQEEYGEALGKAIELLKETSGLYESGRMWYVLPNIKLARNKDEIKKFLEKIEEPKVSEAEKEMERKAEKVLRWLLDPRNENGLYDKILDNALIIKKERIRKYLEELEAQ